MFSKKNLEDLPLKGDVERVIDTLIELMQQHGPMWRHDMSKGSFELINDKGRIFFMLKGTIVELTSDIIKPFNTSFCLSDKCAWKLRRAITDWNAVHFRNSCLKAGQEDAQKILAELDRFK